MKKTGKCPKCGSTDVIIDAKAVDRAHGGSEADMKIATFRKPDALVFKQKQETPVSAWVCGSCGFVEFYADDPRSIKT
jgi:predicted nucleic-acid-binding Zn-ribbon protein